MEAAPLCRTPVGKWPQLAMMAVGLLGLLWSGVMVQGLVA